MFRERRLLAEGLPTFVTFIGLLPRVCALMNHEGRLHTEGFPTLLTLIGLLPCVSPLMINEV